MNAASSAEPDFTGRCSVAPPAAAAPPSPPKPPRITLKNERFIALHMMYDRIAPDEPTSEPGDDQHRVVQREADARRRPARVAVEHRHHHRHVRAADRDDDQHARARTRSASSCMNGSHACVSMKMMPKPSIAMREQQVDHVLARIHDRRALEQAELVLARELAERDHRTRRT